MRLLNNYLLSIYEKHYSETNKPLFVIYEAPTGYGKSSILPYIAYKTRKTGIFYGYIHVLPMRSIVRSLYNDLTGRKKYPYNLLEDAVGNVGYQAGGMFLQGKDPFYSKLYNVTTIDSFMLNLLKLSIGEPNTYYKHYEAVRSMIFTSMITLDEAHLYGGDPGAEERYLYTTFTAIADSLRYLNTPLNIVSATIPSGLGNNIYRRLKTYAMSKNGLAVWIRYGDKIRENDKVVGEAIDGDFQQIVEKTKWETRILSTSIGELAKKIVDDAETGKKILVVVNKPSRAVKIHSEISDKGLDPILIHGRMKYAEREIVEDKITDASIVVATQVVEAGIDVSFDTIYTDPAPPTSLIQRIGRVNRKLKEEVVGEVNIVYDGEESWKNIYESNIVSNTLELIKRYADKINWRLPKRTSIAYNIGYVDIIDKIYSGIEPEPDKTLKTIFEEIILSIRLDWRNTSKPIYKNCLREKGSIRSSFFLSLYPLDLEDHYLVDDLTIEKLSREAVPASLHWIISKADKLLPSKPRAVYLVLEKQGETRLCLEEVSRDISILKQEICRGISGYTTRVSGKCKGGFFQGIVIDPQKYVPWRGLIIE